MPVEHMDAVLEETLILEDGEELFAPEEECSPFRLEAYETPKQEETQSELTAH